MSVFNQAILLLLACGAAEAPAAELKISNAALEVSLQTDGAFRVVDRRTGRVWAQRSNGRFEMAEAQLRDSGIEVRLADRGKSVTFTASLRLEADRPELLVELQGEGPLPRSLAYPSPFETAAGDLLILPVNEGISYPVDDASLPEMSYILYGGHGLCMAWYGVTDGKQGVMSIVETPDDASVRVPRVEGRLCLAPEWQPQKGQFGPARRVRYLFLDEGGYVAMAKRYRAYAQSLGLLKTLAEKRDRNPHVDLLVGAVNVWCWDAAAAEMCTELQSLGIDRILWSNRAPPEQITKLNALGVLSSRYDIYQDAMNPANFPLLRGKHADWTSEAWANGDLMIDAKGEWVRGWQVTGKDGTRYPCGVLCDSRAVEYARQRIPPELKTHPYRCRFIDTTTASPWRECYDPQHPMTRTESREHKMRLLEYISRDCGLVCGSETGHDAAVPYVHYFEGMLSLGPYRVPDSGRDMIRAWDEVPERVAKFQTGHVYRLPLWELVYHDCVIAQWYWGDYNNKLPALWDRRDLWNALYGTPPMFMFNKSIWKDRRDRFVQSYKTIAAVARQTAYAEMLEHRWLTVDHAVQQTRFANGVRVTANFGDAPFVMEDGKSLGPLAVRVEN